MFILSRAVLYAALVVGLAVVFLPAGALSWVGISAPAAVGGPQLIGMALGAGGAVLALWCVVTFAFVGRGTPAPFDPPRRLVVLGPYRIVRNPMVMGVATVLAGGAVYYESVGLALFTGAFLVVAHLFVVLYEEPTLRRLFGDEYEAYSRRVRRWWPRLTRPGDAA